MPNWKDTGALATESGGTGQITYAAGDLLVGTGGIGPNGLAILPSGTGGQLLIAGTTWSGLPWTDVAFNAANFTTNTAATWTLTSGDQTLFRSLLIGDHLMAIEFMFDTTSVSAGTAQLRFVIPAGKTAAKDSYMDCWGNDNNTGWVNNINCFTQTGLGFVALQPGAFGAGAWAISTNLTAVRGVFLLEV